MGPPCGPLHARVHLGMDGNPAGVVFCYPLTTPPCSCCLVILALSITRGFWGLLMVMADTFWASL